MKRAARESQGITRSPRSGGSTFPETLRTEPTREKKALYFVFLLCFFISCKTHTIYISELYHMCFWSLFLVVSQFTHYVSFFLAYFFFRFVSVLSSKRTVPKLYLMSLRSIYKTNIHNSLITFCFSYVLEWDSVSL